MKLDFHKRKKYKYFPAVPLGIVKVYLVLVSKPLSVSKYVQY